MSNKNTTTHAILILSLFPDTGHVSPLLQFAKLLIASGEKVKIILPNECESLTNWFGLEAIFFGHVLGFVQKNIFDTISGSIFLHISPKEGGSLTKDMFPRYFLRYLPT